MDILYYIGNGSKYDNKELKYSLRSLEKHCKDIGELWIVGEKPNFLNKKLKYIKMEDKFAYYTNAFLKTNAAIEAGISKDFLLMNDDFFMLEDFEAEKYPYFHRGEIMEKAKNDYQQLIVDTGVLLKKLEKPTLHYGVHCPMRINGEKYQELKKYYKKKVSPRCLYGNFFEVGGQKVIDNKGYVLKRSNTLCYSTKDFILDGMFNELEEMFPEPSRWEK